MIDFKLDPKSGVPFYRQIIDQIRYGVASGRLKVGEQLPTVRALAVQLKVNLNTVSKAYRELEIQSVLARCVYQITAVIIFSHDEYILYTPSELRLNSKNNLWSYMLAELVCQLSYLNNI